MSASQPLSDAPEIPGAPDRERLAAEGTAVAEARKFLQENTQASIPTAASSPEDWAAFYNRLGRPERAEQYDLSGVEVPEAVRASIDPAIQSELIAMAHGHGLSQRQLSGLLSDYYRMVDGALHQRIEHEEQHGQAAEAMLRSRWGSEYDARLGAAQKGLLSLAGGDHELASAIAHARLDDGSLVGDHVGVLEALAGLAARREAAPAAPATPAPATTPSADTSALVRRILASTGRDSNDAYAELSRYIDKKIGG